MTPGESTDTARVAALLAEHVLYGEHEDGDYECGCKWIASPDAWEEDFGEEIEHRAHVAAALVEAGVGFVAQAKAEERERIESLADVIWTQVLEASPPSPEWIVRKLREIAREARA